MTASVIGLDKAIDIAEDVIDEMSGAKARLRDILVEELSIVGRAANKRKFLIIKSAGSTQMTDPNATEIAKGLKLSGAVRDALTGVLKDALERLVGTAKAIEAAESDDQATSVPADLTKELKAVYDLLGAELAKSGEEPKTAMADGMAGALKEIAEVAMSLAAAAAEDKLPKDYQATIKNLVAMLSGMAEKPSEPAGDKYPEPAAKADEPAAEPTVAAPAAEPAAEPSTAPVAEPAAAEPAVAADPAAADPLADVAKSVAGLAEQIEKARLSGQQVQKLEDLQAQLRKLSKDVSDLLKGPVAAPARKEDDDRMAAMLAKLEGMFESLSRQTPAPTAPAASAEVDSLAKRINGVEELLKGLSAQVKKAVEEPPSRASSSTTSLPATPKGGILPLYFNDPAFDTQTQQ